MGPYLILAGVSAVLLPWSWHRSRNWTRYRLGTGAPVVWILLLITGCLGLGLVAAGQPELAREFGTGGLIGAGLGLSVLWRNSTQSGISDGPD